MLLIETELKHINDEVGAGVFATKRIPKGTIVWVQDPMDQVFPPEKLEEMHPLLRAGVERYAYGDHHGNMVLCWDLARFFNHCCESTCLGLDFPFEIVVRDIEAGEELTDDYGTFYMNETEGFECRCGTESCRGGVGPQDREKMMSLWKTQLREALAHVHEVPQPLLDFLPEGVLEETLRRYGPNS